MSKVLAHWAALAQKRYFAAVHEATQDHESTPDAIPPADLLQKLSAMFQDSESLRLQSQRVREVIDLFDTAVVPKYYDQNPASKDTD
jgi:molybdopterin converting factor small subunit